MTIPLSDLLQIGDTRGISVVVYQVLDGQFPLGVLEDGDCPRVWRQRFERYLDNLPELFRVTLLAQQVPEPAMCLN